MDRSYVSLLPSTSASVLVWIHKTFTFIFFLPSSNQNILKFNNIYSLISGDVLTGDSNGNVFIWGRGYNAVTKALRNVHEGPIFSICVLKDGSIVTGGGKDRKMVQFDSTYRKSGLEATVRASYWLIWIWDFRDDFRDGLAGMT